jgi:CxxC-x17-CxxC domain-containing protein
MFSATCAECGKPCEVPFRPTGDKPVFCSYCFGKNRANESAGGRDGGKTFAPRQDFQKKDFGSQSSRSDLNVLNVGQTADLKKQIETLSAKVDVLIAMITNGANIPAKVPTAEKTTEKAPEKTEIKAQKKVTSAKKSPSKKK